MKSDSYIIDEQLNSNISDQSTINKWSVVHFTDSNEINVVLSSWICEENEQAYCCWPLYDKDITKTIKRSTHPDSSWPMFPIRIMKEYDTYKEGKIAEKKFEEESTDQEIEKTLLGRGHRKSKRKLNGDFTESISPPPKLTQSNKDNDNVKIRNMNTILESSEVAINRKSDESSQELESQIVGDFVINKDDGVLMIEHNTAGSAKPTENSDNTYSTITMSSRSSSVPSSSRLTDETLLINTFGILVEVKEIVNEIKYHITNSQAFRPAPKVSNFDSTPKEAFKKYRKLMKYNEKLEADEDAQNQLELLFYLLGGSSIKEASRRGLKQIFSNKLATRCSWTGKGGNYPLQNLQLMRLLKLAVRKRFSELTDHMFEEHVKIWFRQGQLRYTRECAAAHSKA